MANVSYEDKYEPLPPVVEIRQIKRVRITGGLDTNSNLIVKRIGGDGNIEEFIVGERVMTYMKKKVADFNNFCTEEEIDFTQLFSVIFPYLMRVNSMKKLNPIPGKCIPLITWVSFILRESKAQENMIDFAKHNFTNYTLSYRPPKNLEDIRTLLKFEQKIAIIAAELEKKYPK
ncbi:MAG: hypothetical protein KAS12_03995 [Candidatus Aenigmarchaeota archaeon]|nr:hypothetical protein [Candidatus Aenigmarchaeota archaeon]